MREYCRQIETLAVPLVQLAKEVLELNQVVVRMRKPIGLTRIMDYAQRAEERNLALKNTRPTQPTRAHEAHQAHKAHCHMEIQALGLFLTPR